MKDLIKDIKFINDSKEFENKDVQIDQLITDFIKKDRSEQLILNGVSGSYSEKQVDDAYDKGFKDGCQRDR